MIKRTLFFILFLTINFSVSAGKYEKDKQRFKCRIGSCQRSFAVQSHARRHLRSHQDHQGVNEEDEKYLNKYKCPHCNFRLLDKRKYDQHMARFCSSCNRCFARKSMLKYHVCPQGEVVPEGEKPHLPLPKDTYRALTFLSDQEAQTLYDQVTVMLSDPLFAPTVYIGAQRAGFSAGDDLEKIIGEI